MNGTRVVALMVIVVALGVNTAAADDDERAPAKRPVAEEPATDWFGSVQYVRGSGAVPDLAKDLVSDIAARFLSGNLTKLLTENPAGLFSGNDPELLSGNEAELLSGNDTRLFSQNEAELISGNKVRLLSNINVEINLGNIANRSGAVDSGEFSDARPGKRLRRAKSRFEALDTNGDGSLTFDEFISRKEQ